MDRRNVLLAAATVPLAVRIPITTQEMGWRPIATAPKDGTVVLLYYPPKKEGDEYVHTGKWYDYEDRYTGYEFYRYGKLVSSKGNHRHAASFWSSNNKGSNEVPTHWMPIPQPPESA